MRPDADTAIWNRACERAGLAGARAGDTALTRMILADGLVQNGGVLHAVEVLGEELPLACDAYRFFGLPEGADVFERAARWMGAVRTTVEAEEEAEGAFNRAYWDFEKKKSLLDAFHEHLALHPELYDPA